MIWKVEYGDPFPTEAVVGNVEMRRDIGPFSVEKTETGYEFSYELAKEDQIYGLGEQVRGINKRGWIYESYATDDPEHTEGKHSLYSAHNFFLVRGEKKFGAFFDDPGRVVFDFGYTDSHMLRVTVMHEDFAVYLITGEKMTSIVEEFRKAIGSSYLPPLWAFGYQQSRWGYQTEQDIKDAVEEHRKRHIPLDAVYLDIDYMERFKDFTIHPERFPDMEGLIRWLSERHVKLVPIIDAGVKVEEGYPVYEEGARNGYFVRNGTGEPFTGGVWPGRVHFPDVFQEEARAWFGSGYETLLSMGAGGFWNDMNEPSLFYSEAGLQKLYEKAGSMIKRPKELDGFLELQPVMNGLANCTEDYQSMYHIWKGKKLCHDRVHNLYGAWMTRAAAEAIGRYAGGERRLIFSRSSYIGMHRYAGMWTGDNMSWWSHLKMAVQMMPSLNMCGFLYAGPDLGGFADDVTEDLMLRWLQFDVFVPLMRNHSALGTRRQEIYQFSAMEAMRSMIRFRYCLLPYLYSEFMKAALSGKMLFRPIGFDWEEDPMALCVEDQLMVGESIMIAPVCEQNARGRYVYLPEDMLLVRCKTEEGWMGEIMPNGVHYVDITEEEIVFFIRKGRLIVTGQAAESTEEIDFSRLQVSGYVEKDAVYEYYMDDGIHQVAREVDGCLESRQIQVFVRKTGSGYTIEKIEAETYLEGGKDRKPVFFEGKFYA